MFAIASPSSSKQEIEIKFIGTATDSKIVSFAFFYRRSSDPPIGRTPPQFTTLGNQIGKSNYKILSLDSQTNPETVVIQHVTSHNKVTLKAGESILLPE